ncbi:hypothetical protein VC83_07641 [Pseudogymnoascus destructans]|uniref:Peptide-methionine (R)-S-oxide reductase n=2 Tax=Pseudogymnoascus destructans TaxID=655981 RepID=L8FXF0_PSED2|nr:uncharacterized protein VC83_07641 [Pseudogymnoascus destructans]ELR05635.1 hypothetical protein GMDG_01825 [Pseudogymnoascus destructans 20631-21]OAF55564.1 hypothetical protein VC83_07641 [Pseudogymnoascus destructans]
MRPPSWPDIVARTTPSSSSYIPLRSSAPRSSLHRTPAHAAAAFTRPMPTLSFLGSLFSSKKSTPKMTFPLQKSNDEWQAVLSKEQFRILRQKGTEPPGTGKYDTHAPETGTYTCAGCSAPLYTASHKFVSGCGWPAYFDSIPGAVERRADRSMGATRTEIICANCGGHLGHVFKGEGYETPTDERHCVNSVSLNFSEKVVEIEGRKSTESKV